MCPAGSGGWTSVARPDHLGEWSRISLVPGELTWHPARGGGGGKESNPHHAHVHTASMWHEPPLGERNRARTQKLDTHGPELT